MPMEKIEKRFGRALEKLLDERIKAYAAETERMKREWERRKVGDSHANDRRAARGSQANSAKILAGDPNVFWPLFQKKLNILAQ
jgi:hypothetical protein